jgi:hypothetical protein
MPQVIDNTVLTNFCLVDRLDILRRLFGKVYVTHEVREEVIRGLDEGYTFWYAWHPETGRRAGAAVRRRRKRIVASDDCGWLSFAL